VAPEEQTQRWGIGDSEVDGLVAYAALWRVEGHKFRFDVMVSPRHLRRGHGNRLFELVSHEAERAGAGTLQARALATDTDSLSFLERRQFVETMRMRGFVLPLARIDVATFTAAAHSCSPDVSITMVSRTQYNDAEFWERITDLHDAAREGWPDPDPGGPVTSTDPARLRRMLLPSQDSAISFLIASDGGQLVGYSLLSRRLDTGEAQFASTAVRPSVRGRRIATALRARCILSACQAGFATVRSASGSASLIRINARLGFQETYSEVRLVRRLRSDG
jgi:N-acetylglutamate synthase-like GNAT family acetyltransferase